MNSAGPIRAGQRLGKYRIQRRIANGGFAAVYRALDTVEGIPVALKVPRREAVTPQAMEWFRKEVRLHAGLDHPHVLQLKTADLIDGLLVIAYPLGVESLGDRMRRRMGLNTFLSLAGQMLDAVAHAHSRNVIHCDVKPDNFILFEGNALRLADFSISRLARRTVIASGSGTVGYVAPEQAMGKASFRSDVFSLGLVLYQMLAAELPEWPFRWPLPGLARVRRKVPPAFVDFLQRARNVNPARRFRDGIEMKQAFERLLPQVRRFAAGRRRRRNGQVDSGSGSDWREVRFRQFQRELGSQLELAHRCGQCAGPLAEAMIACPWCGVEPSFGAVETRFPARCPRCKRGRKLDWRFCAWCYGGGMPNPSERRYPDRRYRGRCRAPSCRGPLMPFMRYCPWCRRRVQQREHLEGVRERCATCRQPVVSRYWDHCPWCARPLARR
jgi:serine/threonine-protein kinase